MKCMGSVWAYVRENKYKVSEYKAILYHRDTYFDGDYYEPGTTYLKLLSGDGKAVKKLRCAATEGVPCDNTLWYYSKTDLDLLAIFANATPYLEKNEKITKNAYFKLIDILKIFWIRQNITIHVFSPYKCFSTRVDVVADVLTDDILHSIVYKITTDNNYSDIHLYIKK